MLPVSNLHPFFPLNPSIRVITSSPVLMRTQLIKPSNTTTKGTTGITYVQKRCVQSPQNQYQLPSHNEGPSIRHVNNPSNVRSCNSKIPKPEEVSNVFWSMRRAEGSSKWWNAREKSRKTFFCCLDSSPVANANMFFGASPASMDDRIYFR